MTGLIDQVEIERMSPGDLDRVMEIERDSYPTPWSRWSFQRELADRRISLSIVAKLRGRVVGYAVAWFVAKEVHVGNIAVHRKHRRRGIAQKLFQSLIEEALSRKCVMATLEVRQSNRAAIALYEKLGFKQVAIRKGFYLDTREDALVMMKELRTTGMETEEERC